jgi:hypothetical protein
LPDTAPSARLDPGFLVDTGASVEYRSKTSPVPATKPARAAAPVPASPGWRGESVMLTKAKRFYYNLKMTPKFRNSRAIHQWNREFLAHEDLRKINAKYLKDRDAVAFINAVVQSPNFMNLAARHFREPDIQAFAEQMMCSKEVTASIGIFGKDDQVNRALARLRLLKAGGPPQTISR